MKYVYYGLNKFDKELIKNLEKTTTNMIQKLKPLFVRNPLISKGI